MEKRRHRKGYTKIKDAKLGNLLTYNKKLSTFKTDKAKVRYLVKENYMSIKIAVNEQMPEKFDYAADAKEVFDFVWERIKASKTIEERRHPNKKPSIKELILKEFSTETYQSRNDRIISNIEKMFSKRETYTDDMGVTHSAYKFQDVRDKIKAKLGTVDLRKADFEYYDVLPRSIQRSPNSMDNGYMFTKVDFVDNKEKINRIFLENVRVQTDTGEYIETVVVHEL